MNENDKEDAFCAHENAHEQTQRFLKELRGFLADCSDQLAHEGASSEARASNKLADRAEGLLSQVVAYGHELEEDRRDLAALLKAAHEIADEAIDPVESQWSQHSLMPLHKLDDLNEALKPYQDRVDLFCGIDPATPGSDRTAILGVNTDTGALVFAAISSTVAEDLEDDIAEVITDSINGPEWTSSHAAKAVVDYLTARNHPAATPGTVTPAAIIHRLSVMARVAERDGRLGDVQSCRDAMRIIGELQSHVTRLTDPEVAYIRDPENGNAPPAIVELGQWARHPGIDERLHVVSISWGSDQTPSCEAVGEESGLRMTLPLANMRADTLPLDGQ